MNLFRLAKYVVVGGISVAFDYAVTIILYKALKVNLSIAVTTGFLTALVINFLMNKLWTFEKKQRKGTVRQAIMYVVLVLVNLAVSNIVIILLKRKNIDPIISKPFISILIACWNYIIYKKLIFKDRSDENLPIADNQ